MDFEAYSLEGIHFIEVSGEINADNCTGIKDEILGRVETSATFMLNLRNVPYIDSTGIGTLMAMSNVANQHGGKIALVGVCESIMRILDLVNASSLFSIYEGSKEALQDLKNGERAKTL